MFRFEINCDRQVENVTSIHNNMIMTQFFISKIHVIPIYMNMTTSLGISKPFRTTECSYLIGKLWRTFKCISDIKSYIFLDKISLLMSHDMSHD